MTIDQIARNVVAGVLALGASILPAYAATQDHMKRAIDYVKTRGTTFTETHDGKKVSGYRFVDPPTGRTSTYIPDTNLFSVTDKGYELYDDGADGTVDSVKVNSKDAKLNNMDQEAYDMEVVGNLCTGKNMEVLRKYATEIAQENKQSTPNK